VLLPYVPFVNALFKEVIEEEDDEDADELDAEDEEEDEDDDEVVDDGVNIELAPISFSFSIKW
jgi:hypothetical protein